MYFYRVPPIILTSEPTTATIPRFGNQVFTITANNLPEGEFLVVPVITNTNSNFTLSSESLIFGGDPPSTTLTVGYIGTGSQTTQITISEELVLTVNGIP
jgi:hypothetical protein